MADLSKLTILERIELFNKANIGISWDTLGCTSVATLNVIFAELNVPGHVRAEIEFLHANHPERSSGVTKIGQIRKLMSTPQLASFVGKPLSGSTISRNKSTTNESSSKYDYWTRCLFCGTNTLSSNRVISEAHIIEGVRDYSYECYGTAAGYADDLDPSSSRNFIPLCGTLGQRGTCHDLYCTYKVALLYNPFESCFYLYTPSNNFDAKLHGKVITTIPDKFKPYRRLLAARAYATGYLCLDEAMLNLPNLVLADQQSTSQSDSELAGSQYSEQRHLRDSQVPQNRLNRLKRARHTASAEDDTESFKRQKRAERFGTAVMPSREGVLSNGSWAKTLVHTTRYA